MEFRILGPLEVVSEGDPVTIRGAKPRALLALFLVHANRVVARDRLIDDLWEGSPPESAVATLQTYVSQLRASLGLESLHTRPRGYVLEVGAFELDALRFERVLEATPRARDARAPLDGGSTGGGAVVVAGPGAGRLRRRALGRHRGRPARGAPARRP